MASLAAFHPAAPRAGAHHPRRPNPATGLLRLRLPAPPRRRARAAPRLAVSASSAGAGAASPSPAAGWDRSDAASSLERCLAASGSAAPASAPTRAPPAMKGGKQYGSFGAVTLERKVDLSKGRKKITPELFNREFVDAVMQEWCKTMSNLPAGLRQAYEMGLVSSAQMVRYLAIFARPTHSRSFSRALPGWLSRGLVGRTLADPSFPHKIAFEFMATFFSSVWWEMNIRKERFEQEWDLAVVNALTASCCNVMVLGLLAPCRSYGSTSRFDFQNAIEKLPNNIFENSYPLRQFDLQKRISAFFYKAAELSLLGVVAGSIQGGLSKALSARKERRLSVTIPSVSTNALGYGAFLGLYANLRYQLLCGLDQYMVRRFDVLGVAIFFSTALRLTNIQIGESSRRTWLGEEADPQYSDRLLRAYKRPVEVAGDQQDSRWFISKDAIVSGLGLLGIKQGGTEAALSKPRRKRVVRKKVAST
uniref:Protein RETICULATA-RELATED 1, chloroplastic n=1 Tax=Oryza glumipatula TaxID=40148 RepID=A0A0E0BRD3_9ORYZ